MRHPAFRLIPALLACLLLLTACTGQQEALPDLSGLGAVTAVSREEGSGTRAEFERLTGSDAKGTDRIALSTEEVGKLVAADENAIGYVSLQAAGSGAVKVLSVDGIDPAESLEKNGSYPLCRNYYLAYSGTLTAAENDFLTYVLSAGQEVAAQSCLPVKKAASFLSDCSAGVITICGSSSAAPLLEALAKDYYTYNPNVEIQIQTTDSTSGLTAAIRGECSLAMSSRELKDYESELLEARCIAAEYIAVVVSPSNPLENLTTQQVKTIYDGGVSQWSDLT